MVAKNTNHDTDCECCKGGLAAFKEREQQMFEKHGWVAHFVTDDDPTSPTGFNCHTHGFEQTFDCPDVQIVLPLSPDIAHALLVNIAERLKCGDRFKVGKTYDKIIGSGDRVVLRMILPDKNTMDAGFALQWDGALSDE